MESGESDEANCFKLRYGNLGCGGVITMGIAILELRSRGCLYRAHQLLGLAG